MRISTELNERHSALTASLIVGIIWAFWHLPYFFIPITPHSGITLVNQIGWFVGIVLLSVILAWAYNNTGSVLIAMVLHAMVNTADVLLPLARIRSFRTASLLKAPSRRSR